MGSTALIIGALLLGATGGYWIAQHRIRRKKSSEGPTVAELLWRLVRTADNGIVVLNKFGDVVLHNPRADELGFVRDMRVDTPVRKAAEKAAAADAPVPLDLSPEEGSRGRVECVLGSVRPLGDSFTVVDASDESERVRLEATRRDFVANVSHELKTPVGGLAVLAEAMHQASDDPVEVQRFADKIKHESTRLGALVTELIALSRLQGGDPLPDLTTVEVDVALDEALERGRLAAENAGIEIALDEPSGLLIDGDRTLLVTALSNLIDNAVAYSQHGSPVSISRRSVDDRVEIAVTDRGIGIEPDHQERVFERFFRIDPARSRGTGGTGLGLAIVKHVAANHGGEVRLWSRPGTGSTFTISLPKHADGEVAAEDNVVRVTATEPEQGTEPESAAPGEDKPRTIPRLAAASSEDSVVTAETGGFR